MAKINRIGFGQVEPNHLSAQRTAQIYAQLPADPEIEILENGQFVKYDRVNNECNFDGDGQWMMVFNEVKLYDDRWRESYKDFAMIKGNYTPATYTTYKSATDFNNYLEVVTDPDSTPEEIATAFAAATQEEGPIVHSNNPVLAGQMVPRVIKINIGDSWTTNTLYQGNTSGKAALVSDASTLADITLGAMLKVGTEGFLEPGTDDDFQLQVTEIYTLPDMQQAVKVTRIK